ncbi:hypothetical protein FNF31_03909 [Cafeteria roenbergensis]|uniref:Acid phosphatase n=1 Tax=Cafeteria roenbergensis TaxID=33653 RepID=A0A5A8D7S5_CAFRO|nr:hypothetical protein FNF31_03909 [Cafeteria roenbergensis]
MLTTIDQAARVSALSFYLGGEYDRGVRLACKASPRASDAGAARLGAGVAPRCTPAIVFDVDDTALSSFHAMADASFTAVPTLLPHFFLSANAPAIEPVLGLYRYARALGLVPIFLTERPPEARKATLEALNRAGFTGFRHLITRSACPAGASAEATASQFKYEARMALTRRGFRIVCVVGDQDHDFAGGFAGEFQCKLPNMLYDSL